MAAVMHAPMHAPNANVRKAARLARRAGVLSIGFSETYRQLHVLRTLLFWRLVIGPGIAGRRGWAKDAPIVVRRRKVKLIAKGAEKVARSLGTKVAPARGITWAVYRERRTGKVWLHIALHPDAAVEGHSPHEEHVRLYAREMAALKVLKKRLCREHQPDRVVITGDLQWHSTSVAGAPVYAPPKVAKALGLHAHHIAPLDWILTDAPVHQLDVIDEAENGQDHCWAIAHL